MYQLDEGTRNILIQVLLNAVHPNEKLKDLNSLIYKLQTLENVELEENIVEEEKVEGEKVDNSTKKKYEPTIKSK